MVTPTGRRNSLYLQLDVTARAGRDPSDTIRALNLQLNATAGAITSRGATYPPDGATQRGHHGRRRRRTVGAIRVDVQYPLICTVDDQLAGGVVGRVDKVLAAGAACRRNVETLRKIRRG